MDTSLKAKNVIFLMMNAPSQVDIDYKPEPGSIRCLPRRQRLYQFGGRKGLRPRIQTIKPVGKVV